MEIPEEARELFVEAGKKGGRPRTVPHSGLPGCRCSDCRKRPIGAVGPDTKPKVVSRKAQKMPKKVAPEPQVQSEPEKQITAPETTGEPSRAPTSDLRRESGPSSAEKFAALSNSEKAKWMREHKT